MFLNGTLLTLLFIDLLIPYVHLSRMLCLRTAVRVTDCPLYSLQLQNLETASFFLTCDSFVFFVSETILEAVEELLMKFCTKKILGYQIKKKETSGACGTNGRQERCMQGLGGET